ncbi:MAG: hypothetical protein M4D80_35570 [Myxococcota bacterium]|nr:hypothetical protein [Deltaproteobacteria bacterium]MDQ3340508.1 hypothetical protein [Myxococcota bacterium]
MRAVFILLWLLGTEVLPNLHLATHGRDHTHAANGTMISHGDHGDDGELERLHQLAHEQAGRPCSHAPKKPRKQDQLAFDRVPHAAAGIAHHATALLDPPPPLTSPVAAPHAETWHHAEPIDRITFAAAARPSARGPPFA